MNIGYLDDVSLGGPVDTVAADVAQIAKVGGDMGLHLNASKCELIAHQNLSVTDELLQSFTRVDVGSASLLGAPLFHGSELDKSWSGCCDDPTRAAKRLCDIGCQDALILLRSSFSARKVLHLLRCAPSVSHAALQTFDSLLRDCVQCITNSKLSDIQWLQASLPVRDGGLGVRRVSSLAIPAYTWLQRQAHSPYRWTFSQAVLVQMIHTFKPTCRHGHPHLVPFQILCQLNSRFGTVLAFKLIVC